MAPAEPPTRRRSCWRAPVERLPSAGLAPAPRPALDHRVGAAVLSGPSALLEPAHDHDPAALRQRLRGVLGLVPPDDDGEERRLLLPRARHRHPEHGPGDPRLGVPQLGVRRSGCRRSSRRPRSWSCPFLMPGRAVCPALGTGGRWTPWHANRPPGASGGANEVGPVWIKLPSGLGSGAGLVGGACGWGRACQPRPASSLHPGRGGRTRLPPRELLAARPRLLVQRWR